MINDCNDLFSWSEAAGSSGKLNSPGTSIAKPSQTALSSDAGWMKSAADQGAAGRTVSANELTSLSALIIYVAGKTGVSEFRTERELSNRFSVPNVKCLPAHQFDQAIRFLVDRVPAEIAAA